MSVPFHIPSASEDGFLVRVDDRNGYNEVWNGNGWSDAPPDPSDAQLIAVGGIRVSIPEADRVMTEAAGEPMHMIPNPEGN